MRLLDTLRLGAATLVAGLVLSACSQGAPMMASTSGPMMNPMSTVPSPDPRVGLGAGLFDAEEAIWNMRLLSATPPPEAFVGVTNSDLAFKDNFIIQGNYNGVQIWDMTNPAAPELVTEYVCPASQSDVSVYGDLMFVSGEGLGGRLDCGTQGNQGAVSPDRLRGIRIFDISDIRNPEYVSNVQTCRGSHTHSVLKDPNDDENVYVYVSGSASVRPDEELPGCSSAFPEEDSNSALFRIEVIQVPLDDPTAARIVSSPRIFDDLEAPPTRERMAPSDIAAIDRARAEGKFVVNFGGQDRVLPDGFAEQLLRQMIQARGGEGDPTDADSTMLREQLPQIIAERFGAGDDEEERRGPDQCHDITLYPEIGLAGGACEGYGLLLDISNPAMPRRIDAVADSNFAYWHSATFNNDGTKVLFTDEWGGGGQPKCRADDPKEWGANAIFDIEDGEMDFVSYYKIPAAQTSTENCVAHNGSLIPIPGRDVMVQSWYQGGISIFDWTDSAKPMEIAFHDRGPIDADEFQMGGSWSVYWYNGYIVSSEIARGLDVFELTPSAFLTANEIEAANTVEYDLLNAQGQPKYTWPASFALARAYVDQLERSRGLEGADVATVREMLSRAEGASGSARRTALMEIASMVDGKRSSSSDAAKVGMLADAVRALAS
ncbi:LVIVD repeat-containing protein [Rubrivirga sp.]|uniref:LVIVD repeat-containing protein n=1 Tax=Rubrivirga sp. TaxID=1885344 RepID=UPI003C731E05